MGGVVARVFKKPEVQEQLKKVTTPRDDFAAARQTAEQSAAKRRASRRAGAGLMGEARLGGEESTLGSVR